MAVTGSLHADFEMPAEYVGELVAASLRSNAWQQLNYNDMVREITGEQKKTDKRSGLTFQHDYAVNVTWKFLAGKQVRVTVEVKDREARGKQDACRNAAYEILEGISKRLEVLKETLANAKPRTNYGKARWATLEDLRKAGYEAENAEGNSVILGPAEGGKKIVIPPEQTCRHAIVCGPTGCGKSSSIFKPNLFERTKVSAIVSEATAGDEPPDLYSTTAGYRAQAGSKIYYFNPDDLSSVRINPLDSVDTIAKAQDMTDLIMRNTIMTKNAQGADFWESCEKHLITALLMHFAPLKKDLAAIRSLVREGAEGMGKVLEKSPVLEVRDEYRAFLKISTESIRNGVLAGVLQRLRLWLNPRIAALTSKTDFNVEELNQELFTFYLSVPAQKVSLKPVTALIFNYLLNSVVLKRQDKEKSYYPMALFLDEFTNFGMIPGFADNLSLIRHVGVPIMFGCQDYVQLKSVYGEDHAKVFFGQPATRVVFRVAPEDNDTAKRVSESLGKETVVERTLTTTCQVNEKEFGRDLMTVADVKALDPTQSIFFTPDLPPILMKRFSWKDYEEHMKIPPPHRKPILIDEALIKECRSQECSPKWEEDWDEEQKQMQGKKAVEKPIEKPIEKPASSEDKPPSVIPEPKKSEENRPVKPVVTAVDEEPDLPI